MSAEGLRMLVSVVSVALTVAWSVWLYQAWVGLGRRDAAAGRRTLLIASPSTAAVLVLFSGWRGAETIRLDMIGIIGLDAITLVAAAVLLVTQLVNSRTTSRPGRAPPRASTTRVPRAYTAVLAGYHTAAAMAVVGVYLVQLFPPVLLVIGAWLEGLRRIDVGAALWNGLDPARRQDDVALVLNRLVLAALSYLPFAIVRFAYQARQVARMRRSVSKLEARVQALEEVAPPFDESEQTVY